jgi:tetratricopeptide (TPR) repeat protein
LVRLPFLHVLTTNYDGVLEAAHQEQWQSEPSSFDMDEWSRMAEFVTGLGVPSQTRSYLHLHGSVRRPEQIVIAKEHYDARYVNDQRAVNHLTTLFTVHRIVFVGFSMTDEDVMYLLRILSGRLTLAEPRHFAILPRPATPEQEKSQRSNLRHKYHIEPVYFEATDDYAELPRLVARLNVDVEQARQRRVAQPAAAYDAVASVVNQMLTDESHGGNRSARELLPQVLERIRVALIPRDDSGRTDAKSALDIEIDNVFKYVDAGLPERAIEEYRLIEVREGVKLSPRQRYRLLANTGNALYSKGDKAGAVEAYFQAIALYRESKEARGIEVFAYFLNGDDAKAYDLATALCAQEPKYGRGQCLRINSAPGSLTMEDIEASVPAAVRDDAEVALALSNAAARRRQWAKQEQHARVATKASPAWPDALSALACSILMSEKESALFEADRGIVALGVDRIREAVALMTRAISLVPRTDPANRLAGFHYNRSVCRRLLGDLPGANEDIQEAFRRDPQEREVALAYAVEAEEPKELNESIAALDALVPDNADLARLHFVHAAVLERRNQPGDRARALTLLQTHLANLAGIEPIGHRSDILRLAIRLLIVDSRRDEALKLVNSVDASVMGSVGLAILQGQTARLLGDADTAIAKARIVVAEIADDASWFDRREAATLSQNCGLYQHAVRLWKTVVDLRHPGSDTLRLLQCAYSANDGKTILEACRTLRDAGHEQREYLNIEVNTLARAHEPEKAIALVTRWLETHPTDKDARLSLSLLAMTAGRQDLIEVDPAKLPDVAEVPSPIRGSQCALVLSWGLQPMNGLEYAYRLWRRFPDEMVAQRALCTALHDPTVPRGRIERPTVVDHNAAICIARDGEPHWWLYVEDGENPSATRNEFSPDHELVDAMWGMKPGDTVVLHDHKYTILEVEHRIVRRANEILEHFEERFPEHQFFKRLQVPSNPPPEASVEERLGEVWKELKRQEGRREVLESLYKTAGLPIATFARLHGRSVFDTLRYFASEPALGVRAAPPLESAWDAAIKMLRPDLSLVLDATALATIHLLDLHDLLPRLGLKFIVPQAVLNEVRDVSLNAATPGRQGTIGINDGRPYVQEVSPQQLEREVEQLERTIRFVREHCEVVGGEAIFELPVRAREELIRYVGEGTAHAAAIARVRGALLWTDDELSGLLVGTPEFGVRSVWTQVLLHWGLCRMLTTDAEYLRAVGSLIRFGYVQTRLNSANVADILALEGWTTESPTVRAIISLMGGAGLSNRSNQKACATALVIIWDACPDRQVAKRLILEILERIGRKRAGPLLAARIYKRTLIEGMTDTRVRTLKHFLRSWRSGDGECRPAASRHRGKRTRG